MEKDGTNNDNSIETIKRLDAAWFVLNQLEHLGYQAYLVGGCVRDMLLGQTPADYDVCTNAHPEKVQDIFEKTIPTGIKHGTISVLVENERIEVTTFRREQQYMNARRPSKVEYIDELKDDLARRDFTFNAMAMDRKGKIHDPFLGMQDLQNRILRAVGDPNQRFQEDALRMLRAVRFATVLHAQIESATRDALHTHTKKLAMISRERIRDEWNKILLSDFQSGMNLLLQFKMVPTVFRKLQHFSQDSWKKASAFSNSLSKRLDLRHAGLFWILKVNPSEIRRAMEDLRQPKQLIQSVLSIVLAMPDNDPLQWTESKWARYLFTHGRETAYMGIQIFGRMHVSDYEQKLLSQFQQAEARQAIWSVQELAITGQDLIEEL